MNIAINEMNKLTVSMLALQSHHTKLARLGSSEYQTYAKKALFTSINDNSQQMIKRAMVAMNGQGKIPEHLDVLPDIAPPVTKEKGATDQTAATSQLQAEKDYDAQARMTELLACVQQLSAAATNQNLQSGLKNFMEMFESAANAYLQYAEQLEEAAKKWAVDADSLKAAEAEAKKLEQEMTAAKNLLNEAQDKLTQLTDKAATLKPVPEALQKEIDEAKKEVATDRIALATVTQTHDNYVVNNLNPAINKENQSYTELMTVKEKTECFISSVSPQQITAIEEKQKEDEQSVKSLTFLLALIGELIDKSAADDLSKETKLKEKLSEAAAKEAEKKAKEFEEQQRKAQEMQQTMGCIGKVLGWVVTVVGVVSAAFTGGASLALAAVGLALMIGDQIDQAITGHSFIQDALKPVMDSVVKPLIDAIGKMFTDMLEAMGVNEDKAKMIGEIMGAIVAMIVLVATVFLVGSLASKLLGSAFTMLGDNLVAGMSKDIGLEVAEGVDEAIAETATKKTLMDVTVKSIQKMNARVEQFLKMGMSESKAAVIANRAQMANVGIGMAGTVVQTVGNISAANLEIQSQKAHADMLRSEAMQEVLNRLIDSALNFFKDQITTVNTLNKVASDIQENEKNAELYMASRINVKYS